MKFHDVDTSIFYEEAVTRKKEQLILDITVAFSSFVQAHQVAASFNERGIAGVMRLMEIECLLSGTKGGMELEGTGLTVLCTLLSGLMVTVTQAPGDLALYGELESMLEELSDGEWFA